MEDVKDEGKKAPRTVVEEGTSINGTLTSSCPVLVNGSVEGSITASGVTVAATGSIAGTVTTDTLRSIGRIAGEYDAKNAQLAGVVESKTTVRAETLQLKLTSQRGKIEIAFGSSRTRSH